MLTVAGDDAFLGIALIVACTYIRGDFPGHVHCQFTLAEESHDVLLKVISQVLEPLAIYFTTWFADAPTIADGGSTRDTIIGQSA